MGFEKATPIQSESIPALLNGSDLLGQAQTGTGKTCAFGIPIVEQVDTESSHIQYLILSPTRELAMQITDELHDLTKYKEGVRALAVYGGQPIDRQILALKKRPQIIVGTPGRVLDHMRRKTIRLGNLRGLILDEADEMLNMGFKEDIDVVLESTPPEIQRVCFSATMPAGILKLTRTYLNDAVHVQIEPQQRTVSNISQHYLEVRQNQKMDVLVRLLEAQQTRLGLIFCNTKKRVDEVYAGLQSRGLAAEALHGDMKQMSRTRVMNRFKAGEIRFLVATDVAARGIDVDDIDIVVNYDLPQDEEYYIHRIGRTGRAGRTGKALTLVVGHEIVWLRNLASRTKSEITAMELPTLKSLINSRSAQVLKRAARTFERKPQVLEQYSEFISQYLEENPELDILSVAAALLRQSLGDSVLQAQEIEPVVPYDKLQKSGSYGRPANRLNRGDFARGGRQGGGRQSGSQGRSGARPFRARQDVRQALAEDGSAGKRNSGKRPAQRKEGGRSAFSNRRAKEFSA